MSTAPIIPVAASRTQRREVSFIKEGVAPPSPLYLAIEDRLYIQIDAFVTGVFQFRARVLRAIDSEIIRIAEDFQSVGTLSDSRLIHLPEGYLLSADFRAVTGPTQPGEAFVRANIIRDDIANPSFMLPLISSSVTTTIPAGWPTSNYVSPFSETGRLRIVTGTNPAAGSEITETVPSTAYWEIISILASLATSATVANRIVQWQFDDGVNVFFKSNMTAAQTASQTGQHIASAAPKTSDGTNLHFAAGIPPKITLPPGALIRTNTTALQAGDDWSAPAMLIRSWPVLV